ncbi:MAG: hypothetical protein LQ346_003980 [Caloplaca aetnensis]|nr:MAG: hypothetical protein LQ346_003980 [Caloplaca aetnensis]
MYSCSSTEWCCDKDLVYRGCCSDPSNLLNLGARQFQTTVGGAAPSTSRKITSTSTQNSSQEATTAAVSETASTQSPRSSAPTSLRSSNSTSPASPAAAPTAARSNEASSTPASNSTLGVKIGAGVGVPLGVALIVAVVYISYLHGKHRKRRTEEPQMQPYNEYKEGSHMPAKEPHVLDGRIAHELDGEVRETPIAQLPGSGIER